METKINIAEILKDKPQGTKLYDLLRNIDVYLDEVHITDIGSYIECTANNEVGSTILFDYSELGTEVSWLDGLQILKPSKYMHDWSKFAWKKGDLLVNSCGFQCIFKEWASDDYTKFNGCYSNSRDGYEDVSNAETAKFDKLDHNIAYGYVREIERKFGGKLNMETLEIEPAQPEFKDGDIVCISGMGYLAYGIVKSIDNSSKKLEYYVLNDMSTLKTEDWLSFEDKQIQPITETQKIILFDAFAKEGKAWDAEKKMIVNLKQKDELNPFDKVWVKDNPYGSWEPALFWKRVDVKDLHPYMVIGGKRYRFCEPYEGNEHFLDD